MKIVINLSTDPRTELTISRSIRGGKLPCNGASQIPAIIGCAPGSKNFFAVLGEDSHAINEIDKLKSCLH